MKLADAVVYLGTEITGLRKGLDQAKAETKVWGGGMATIVQGALMGVGMAVTNGVISLANKAKDAIGDSIGAASDMSETVSKINTLFGDSSNDILKWSDNSAKAMGLSKQAALDAVGTLGNMFMQLGSGTEQAAGLSQEMTQMAADLSSFHNVAGGTPEVLEAMTAGFRGEYDALQRYIPTISAATVEQMALEMSGKENVKQLTALEKALAVQAIIMKDAGAATGDFARTSEGLANQQRIADAQTKNLSATIGQALVPVVLTVQTAYNNVLQGAMPAVTAFINDRAVPTMTKLAEAISGLITRLVNGDFEGAWKLVKDMFGAAVNYVTTNLPVWTGKLGEWGIGAWQWIVDASGIAVTKLGEWAVSLWQWVTANAPGWGTKLGEFAAKTWDWLTGANGVISQVGTKLGEWATSLYQWATNPQNIQEWGNSLKSWATKAWEWIQDAIPYVQTQLKLWWGYIKNFVFENLPEWKSKLKEWGDALVEWVTKGAEQTAEKGKPIVEWFKTHFPESTATATKAIEDLAKAWERMWAAIRGSQTKVESDTQTWIQRINAFIEKHGATLKAIIDRDWALAIEIVSNALEVMMGWINVFLRLITGDWSGAWEEIKNVFQIKWDTVKAIASTVWANIRDIFIVALDGIKGIVPQKVQDIVNTIIGAFAGLYDTMKHAGASMLEGIKAGWNENWEGFKQWLIGGLQSITDLLPGSEPKDPNSPLRGLAKRGAALVTNFSSGAETAMAQFKQSITNNLDMVGAGMTGVMGGTVINNNYNNQLSLQGSGYASSDVLSAVQLLNMSYRNA